MKKTLLLTFSLLVLSILGNASTLTVAGQFTNSNGTLINVNLSLDDNGSITNRTLVTDTLGFFSDTFTVNSSQGVIDINFINCNGDTVAKVAYFSRGSTLTTIRGLDYCPITTNLCSAKFNVYQPFDSTRQRVSGVVNITDASVGTGLSYSWDFGDGSSGTGQNLSHSYAGNGPYNLCLTVSNSGCTSTYCDTIEMDTSGNLLKKSIGFALLIGNATLSTKDISSNTLKVYPNPASGILHLELTADIEFTDFRMINVSGRTVLTKDFISNSTNSKQSIDISKLTEGLYLVQLSSATEVVTKKILVK